MTTPYITAVRLGGSPSLPLLVLGPALGTSARALWTRCAAHLTNRFEILAWDLPGHGSNTEVTQPFSIADLAAGVRTLVDDVLTARGEPGGSFTYAGDSVGGAVGLQLLLDLPERVDRAILVCTGAVIGTPQSWAERVVTIQGSGTVSMIERATRTWFSPSFQHLEPAVADELLQALRNVNDAGYVQVCEALADFDVRDRLARIRTPLVAVAGSLDESTPVDGLREIASGVDNGELIVLEDVAHLAAAEAPEQVARIIRGTADEDASAAMDDKVQIAEVFVQYASGELMRRPGLDPRGRSIVALTALAVGGHHQELAAQVNDAVQHGLTRTEITEVLLQTAVYCGTPAAVSASRVAQQVFHELANDRS